MAEVVSLQMAADYSAVVGQVVSALRAGKVVALPMDSAYHLAASGLSPDAAGRLPGSANEPLIVALRSAAAAQDWAPELSPLGQRLARRSWPGPLILAVAAAVDRGLAAWLPSAVQSRITHAGALHLHAPAQRLIMEVLGTWRGPLLLAPRSDVTAEPVRQLGDVADLIVDSGPCVPTLLPTVIAVNATNWRLVRPGAMSEEQITRRAACLIVFVCTGNTCRSPLAEALFKKQLAERLGCTVEQLPDRGFCVLSAGLAAMMGAAAAAEAVATACDLGADLYGHRSRPLTVELATEADYLVAMTQAHLLALVDHFPKLAAVPRLLDPSGKDLADPIGQAREVYAACGRQIRGSLESLVAEVVPN